MPCSTEPATSRSSSTSSSTPDWADLKVRNSGSRLRMKNLRRRRRDGGRGLEIVDALAEAWSIDSGPLGTAVSVRVAA